MDVLNKIREYIGERNVEQQQPQLQDWLYWYSGATDKEPHTTEIYNGKDYITHHRKTLGMCKIMCQEWASLLLNEKTFIVIPDDSEKKPNQQVFDKILMRNNFWVNANSLIEKAFALGTGAFIEYVKGMKVDANGNLTTERTGKVAIQYVQASNIYPITFENNEVTECAFVSDGTNTCNIQIHLKNEKGYYEVTNLTFNKKNGTEEEDKSKTFTFQTQSTTPLFQIVKPNITNNIDIDSPMGISIYANSINTLTACDEKYDDFDTEFVNGKKRLFVAQDLCVINPGEDGEQKPLFDTKDTLFHSVPKNSSGETNLKDDLFTFDGVLRTQEFISAINSEVGFLSQQCGFGQNHFTFDSQTGGRPIQTATAVISQNSDLYRNLKKHEILLEQTLISLSQAIIYLANNYTNDNLNVDTEAISVQFDDSIIEDVESEKKSMQSDIANGTCSLAEYRAKFYGEDLEVAKENVKNNPLAIGQLSNALLPALQAKAITPEKFVELVYGEGNEEITNYIKEQIQANETLNAEAIYNQFQQSENDKKIIEEDLQTGV